MYKISKHCQLPRHLAAFTLMEFVVTMAIMAIIAVMSYSVLLNYYKTSVLDTEMHTLTTYLRRARQLAIGNSTTADYSVKFLSKSYVIFPGASYSPSSPNNKTYNLDTSVIVSTSYANDILTFSNYTGRTNIAGSIYLSAYGITKVININSLGLVESIE